MMPRQGKRSEAEKALTYSWRTANEEDSYTSQRWGTINIVSVHDRCHLTVPLAFRCATLQPCKFDPLAAKIRSQDKPFRGNNDEQ